ncbi:MAG: ABC transporter permease, partial [Acetobacteraceae bacterium]|nr:ABC transporter permease [Acetobacteraceae bacterium]
VLSVWPALRGRTYAQASDLITLMRESGSGALGIVAVVNCLVGAILAFVGAIELRRFGAAIYSADLVGIAIIREMAAVMTAIVMAGRTGGAYAAQIATMQGNEEIDALKALGVPVYQYLVLPRIAALVTMMPLLYLYGCLLGLAGGFVVSVLMLDIAPTLFLAELRTAIALSEFYLGLTKSICFGAFIAIASCRIGLGAGRSAADVGNSATQAVVSGIIGVIAIDAVFAMCADVLGF